MPKIRQPKSTVALALVALVVLAAAVPMGLAQGSTAFSEPDYGKKLFVREALLLETHEIASVVEALTALASNFPAADEIDHRLRAKALAIALRLDGTHPGQSPPTPA